jgi:hypothetical protein
LRVARAIWRGSCPRERFDGKIERHQPESRRRGSSDERRGSRVAAGDVGEDRSLQRAGAPVRARGPDLPLPPRAPADDRRLGALGGGRIRHVERPRARVSADPPGGRHVSTRADERGGVLSTASKAQLTITTITGITGVRGREGTVHVASTPCRAIHRRLGLLSRTGDFGDSGVHPQRGGATANEVAVRGYYETRARSCTVAGNSGGILTPLVSE